MAYSDFPVVIPERGCGDVREGGFYASSTFRPGGRWGAWTWLLGDMGEFSLTITPDNPRQPSLINFPASLLHNRLVQDRVELSAERFSLLDLDGGKAKLNLNRLPIVGLIDQVGSDYYTPMSFAAETKLLGPHRRLSQEMAMVLAPRCPLPIVFVHKHIPFVALDDVTDVSRMYNASNDPSYPVLSSEQCMRRPSFALSNWGIRSADDNGRNSWALPLLSAVDKHKGKAEGVTYQPGIFGVSVITQIEYVAKPGDSEDNLDALQMLNIELTRLPTEEERQAEEMALILSRIDTIKRGGDFQDME